MPTTALLSIYIQILKLDRITLQNRLTGTRISHMNTQELWWYLLFQIKCILLVNFGKSQIFQNYNSLLFRDQRAVKHTMHIFARIL